MKKKVTARNNWYYEFTGLLDRDPQTGKMYDYTISERIIEGYYTQVRGYDLINTRFDPPLEEFDSYITPLASLTEEELEGVIELPDYETPLWGPLLQTGDTMPLYPFIFAGIGVIICVILFITRKRK